MDDPAATGDRQSQIRRGRLRERGGGLVWTSTGGVTLDPQPRLAFHPLPHYLPGQCAPASARQHYGNEVKLERPELLVLDGVPRYLYAPSGTALDGSDGTNCYLLARTISNTTTTTNQPDGPDQRTDSGG